MNKQDWNWFTNFVKDDNQYGTTLIMPLASYWGCTRSPYIKLNKALEEESLFFALQVYYHEKWHLTCITKYSKIPSWAGGPMGTESLWAQALANLSGHIRAINALARRKK